MVKKGQKVVTALARIMPNIEGSTEKRRRLYLYVFQAVVLYGAPVWAEKLIKNKKAVIHCRTVQKLIANRVVSGYRTISADAVQLLARAPPLELLAEMRARVFNSIRANCTLDYAQISSIEAANMREKWYRQLCVDHLPGKATRDVILPVFEQWMLRKHGSMTFYLTQMVTGHGCFNRYLYRIGKVESERCSHCRLDVDTLKHTWEECGSWREERELLRLKLEMDSVTMRSAVAVMVKSPEEWNAVVRFANRILLQKGEAERERQGQVALARRHNRRRTVAIPSTVNT